MSNPFDPGTPEYEAWERQVRAEGAAALDQVAAWMSRYLSVPSEHFITVYTLWAAHTYAIEAFYVTPRLIIDSAEPESGKTRVLELLNLLVRDPIFTMNTTIAALYRRLAQGPRTILLDETDAIFAKGAAQNHEDLRALLNAGYKRGATVDRCVPKGKGNDVEVVEFPVFSPAALAGIAGNMPDTITTRAVTTRMRRRAPNEHVDDFIEEDAAEEAAPIRQALAEWVRSVMDEHLKGARPTMPEGVRDRKAEVWRALLAVADAAGGDWPRRAREACKHFVLTSPAEREVSLNIRLLQDIRAVFEAIPGIDFLPTETLLAELKKIEDAPWADFDLTSRRLADRLKRYEIKPRHNKAKTARGYHLADFADTFRRYLPSDPSEPSNGGKTAGHGSDGSATQTVRQSVRPDGSPDGYEPPDGSPDGSATQTVRGFDQRKHTRSDGSDGSDGCRRWLAESASSRRMKVDAATAATTRQAATGLTSNVAPVADVADTSPTCCKGGPVKLQCQLCALSPTYHRKDDAA